MKKYIITSLFTFLALLMFNISVNAQQSDPAKADVKKEACKPGCEKPCCAEKTSAHKCDKEKACCKEGHGKSKAHKEHKCEPGSTKACCAKKDAMKNDDE